MRGIWAAKQGSRVSTEQRLIVEGTLLTGEGWDVSCCLGLFHTFLLFRFLCETVHSEVDGGDGHSG